MCHKSKAVTILFHLGGNDAMTMIDHYYLDEALKGFV